MDQRQEEHAERERQQLDQRNDELAARVRELESRLSLARAENRDLRDDAHDSGSDHPAREVVRIGGRPTMPVEPGVTGDWDEPSYEGWDQPSSTGARAHDALDDDGESELEEVQEVPDVDDGRPRPVLTLYGAGSVAETPPLDTSTPLQLPPPPHGVPGSLPVARLPEPGAPPQRSARPMTDRPSSADAGAALYRRALERLSARDFEAALRGFTQFRQEHPRHPYAANALYWEAEVHYAMREYRRALAIFTRVVREYPRAAKVSDALFKMGMCHERMGRASAAREIFERVRRDYPGTVAARLSAEENS